MLLSLIGVDWENKAKYAGVNLALAIEGEPELSRVFRKFRRVPQAPKAKADPLTARRPDYQDLLIGLNLWIWVNDGSSSNSMQRLIEKALDPLKRREIKRYGGLSLGESSFLVNEVIIKEPGTDCQGKFLCKDEEGYYSFPVWVHHPRCGDGKTKLNRFSILNPVPLKQPPPKDPRWITIEF
jgi:CRISPR-associated protein Cas5/DevS